MSKHSTWKINNDLPPIQLGNVLKTDKGILLVCTQYRDMGLSYTCYFIKTNQTTYIKRQNLTTNKFTMNDYDEINVEQIWPNLEAYYKDALGV